LSMSEKLTSTSMFKRLVFLDWLRFFCACSVMLYHYTIISDAGNKHSAFSFVMLDKFFRYGYLGVDVFFVISGFVIFRSCQGRCVGDFIKGRFIRIFPAYWFAVIFTSLIIVFFGEGVIQSPTIFQTMINMSMLQQFLGVHHIDDVYWSLSYELLFYFWVSIALFFNAKFSRFFILSLFTLLTILSGFNLIHPLSRLVVNVFMLEWVFYFYIGILLAVMSASNFSSSFRYLSACVGVIFSLGVAIAYCNRKAAQLSLWHNTDIDGLVSVAIVCCVIFVFYFFILPVDLARFFRVQKQPLMDGWYVVFSKSLGDITYPLYLLHGVNGVILLNAMKSFNCGPYFSLCVAVLLFLCMSWVVHILIEKPIGAILRIRLFKDVVNPRCQNSCRLT
jgi:peptidoglycan/LPS O-acetylase OafA/YrhL